MTLAPIEARCVEAFRSDRPVGDTGEPWTAFGLTQVLRAARRIRERKGLGFQDAALAIKEDGSPATALEREIEQSISEALATLAPDAVMVGEEIGGVMPAKGWAVAVDPVDGTWAFLGDTESHSVTLCVFRDGEPRFGFVANAVTGEVAYGAAGGRSRLVQLSLFGERDTARDLPLVPPTDKTLVNLQPSRSDRAVAQALGRAWREGSLRFVRRPGGSPAWSLVEAARGHFTYVNLWSRALPAGAFDLAAGLVVVRAAGGDVVDLEGRSVPAIGHRGPFVAGISPASIDAVRRVVSEALASGDRE